MKHFSSITLGACLTMISVCLFAKSGLAGDQKDLIGLRNSWNREITELPRNSRDLQCSGLGLMRVLAESFMSRHNDSTYAQTYNSLLGKYNCPELATLEYLPNTRIAESIQDPIGQDGSCLTFSEILRANKVIEKQCQNTYIYVKVH